jgi:hypothetical protein
MKMVSRNDIKVTISRAVSPHALDPQRSRGSILVSGMFRGPPAMGRIRRMTAGWTYDLAPLIGRQVVLDTAGPILYLGTLESATENGLWLTDADVHDQREGHASKDHYVVEARQHGIQANRARVYVAQTTVLSLSLLDDVIC